MSTNSPRVKEQQSFDAAVAPFWSAVQDELRRCATEYNKDIGREDLTVTTEPESKTNSFVIHRGDQYTYCCRVNLDNVSREVAVSYSAWYGEPTDYDTRTESMAFEVVLEEGSARAAIADGTPAAATKAILSEWVSHFPRSPPSLRR